MLKIYLSILAMFCILLSTSVFSETLYSINTDTNELVKIDTSSGGVSVVGSLGLNVTGPNLAFINNILYSVDNDFNNQRAKLLRINTSSGVATSLGQLSLNGVNIPSAESLAVKNGKLIVAFTPTSNNYGSTILGSLSLTGKITDTNDVGIDMDALANNNLGQLFAIDSMPGVELNKLYNISSNILVGSHPRNGDRGNSIDDLAFIGTELYGLAKTKLIKINVSTGEIISTISLNKSGAYNGLIAQEIKSCKAVSDIVVTEKNTIITTQNVLLNDTDANGDTLIVTAVDNKSEKGVTIINNNDGTFTYTPIIDFLGSDTFVYVASNNKGCSDSGKVSISVNKATSSSGGGSINIYELLAFFLLWLVIVRKREGILNNKFKA